MGISFYMNKLGFYVNGDFNSEDLYVNFKHDIILYYCISVDSENLGGLYFADFYVFYGLVDSRGFLRIWEIRILLLGFICLLKARKNRFFIPNQVSNEFGAMEVLMSSKPDYPFYQDRNSYSVSIFQKFFKFKVDDQSVKFLFYFM